MFVISAKKKREAGKDFRKYEGSDVRQVSLRKWRLSKALEDLWEQGKNVPAWRTARAEAFNQEWVFRVWRRDSEKAGLSGTE